MWSAAGLGALSEAAHVQDLLKEIPFSSLPPPEFDLRSNNREGTRPCPSIENWIKVFTEHGPTHQNKNQFPPQSLPTGSFHQPLILLLQRADRMKATITDN